MMRLGIFAKTFERPTVEAVFEAVHAHGLSCVQFNLSCAGLPTLPDALDPAMTARIRAAAAQHHVEMAAISGTFNMIHPDPQAVQLGLSRLRVLAAACRDLGTSVITLCTGSRDAQDMWRWHDDNATPQAWADLLTATEVALQIADEEGVTLAFEPERANVIYSAERGHALLAAMQSPRLKVILDPANIIIPGDPREMDRVIDEAFDLLGEHIVIAHAKDRGADDEFRAIGEGILNYDRYLHHLQSRAFDGALVMHGFPESYVGSAVRFLQPKLGKG
jgi:sugar phosphate isomerase/epimerase